MKNIVITSRKPALRAIFAHQFIHIDLRRGPRAYQPWEFKPWDFRANEQRFMPVLAIAQPHFIRCPRFQSLN